MKQTDKLQTEDADLLIKPDLSTFNRLNMNQIDDLIEKGYKDSKKVLKKIF
jgi:NTE family protein